MSYRIFIKAGSTIGSKMGPHVIRFNRTRPRSYMHCPECGARLVPSSGCSFCPLCGWSKCI